MTDDESLCPMLIPQTRVPALLDWGANGVEVLGGGSAGWTVYGFATAREAADFVRANPHAAMRCWRRFEIVDGELMLKVLR